MNGSTAATILFWSSLTAAPSRASRSAWNALSIFTNSSIRFAFFGVFTLPVNPFVSLLHGPVRRFQRLAHRDSIPKGHGGDDIPEHAVQFDHLLAEGVR